MVECEEPTISAVRKSLSFIFRGFHSKRKTTPSSSSSSSSSIPIKYIDDEGDLVNLQTDEDVIEAVRISPRVADSTVVRLHLGGAQRNGIDHSTSEPPVAPALRRSLKIHHHHPKSDEDTRAQKVAHIRRQLERVEQRRDRLIAKLVDLGACASSAVSAENVNAAVVPAFLTESSLAGIYS